MIKMVEKRNVYVGHRYVPKVMGEWNKQETYEGLSIVTYKGDSYTSKKRVPKGIDISNEEYWVVTGNYNAQIEAYREDVKRVSNEVENVSDNLYANFEDFNGTNKPTGVWSEISKHGVNVKWFGAKGDGVTDDTEAFQKTIDYCYDNHLTVFISSGTYLIKDTLFLPRTIKIVGENQYFNGYRDSIKKNSHVKTKAKRVFEASETDNKVSAFITGIYFEGINTYKNGTTTGEEDDILFNDIEFIGSKIEGNTFAHYGTFVHGSLYTITRIQFNHFIGIRRYLLNGGFDDNLNGITLTDSYFDNNYINGRPLTNATGIQIATTAMSSISNNFFDYFKITISLGRYTNGLRIEHNVFDHCFRGIQGNASTNSLIIQSNSFRSLKKTTALSSFSNADSEMNEGVWAAMVFKGISSSVIANNLVNGCDLFFKTSAYPHFDLQIISNVYRDVSKVIEYEIQKSAEPKELQNIYIQDLDKQTVNTLPNPKQSGVPIVTFDKQILFYNGKMVFNDNGIWKDMLGNTVE